MPKIEIICVAYNGYARFIPQLMVSVENQTVKPDKVTVVLGKNHGLKEKIEGLNIIYDKSEPVIGKMLNIGLKQSKADYILATDIDDLMLPNAIEDILEVKKDVVLCDYYVVKGEVVQKWESYNPLESQEHFGGKPGYYAFKRGLAEYEENNAMNIPMLLKLKARGATFGRAKRVSFFYLQRKDGRANVKGQREKIIAAKVIKKAHERYK